MDIHGSSQASGPVIIIEQTLFLSYFLNLLKFMDFLVVFEGTMEQRTCE
jgi:hypothetical protein